ncbi:MAG: dioxygenase [Betaproteobacteria bacterium]|nr:dioxygenase [Betaproteobacteria bacterium]
MSTLPAAAPGTTVLPSLFVSHGSPALALASGPVIQAWQRLAGDLPRPPAILAVSAHWQARQPTVGGSLWPDTIHDFGGFPAPLYELRYDAPGLPGLAASVAGLSGALIAPDQGLDHGAWMPLRAMYPTADIPVVPLALLYRQGPRQHFELGRSLARLRQDGVLILASGGITHNLYDLAWGAGEDEAVPAYAREFQAWIHDALAARDLDRLLDYRRLAPHAERAHPSEEHLLPLFVALGAAWDEGDMDRPYAGFADGALAMDLYRFGGTTPATPATPAAPAA